MFDLRYHVASLAAVFLALIIGILVGVGISDRGLVDSAKTKFLAGRGREPAAPARQPGEADDRPGPRPHGLPDLHQRDVPGARPQPAEGEADRGRLRRLGQGGRRLLGQRRAQGCGGAAGAVAGAEGADRRQAAGRGAQGQPAAAGLRGKANLEALGRALGQELVVGGDTPLWDSLTGASSLVEHVAGGSKMPADGVVVVRTGGSAAGRDVEVPARRVRRARVDRLACGRRRADGRGQLGDQGLPGQGASRPSTTWTRRSGRLALLLLLAGQPGGQYGVKDSATDGALPPLPPRPAAGG